jgi:hypothetical protein
MIALKKPASKLAFKRLTVPFQTLSGPRTIQINAMPVIAPATNPLVTAITVVLTVGAIDGPLRNKGKTAWLAQKPAAQPMELATIQTRR